jgi:hypothetical protein
MRRERPREDQVMRRERPREGQVMRRERPRGGPGHDGRRGSGEGRGLVRRGEAPVKGDALRRGEADPAPSRP